MNLDQQVAEIIVGGVTLLFVGIGFKTMVKSSTNLLRENLFERRRQLFLIVANGRIDPRSALYVRIRSTINGMLRHAEEISVWFLLAAYLGIRKLPQTSASIEDLVAEVDDPQLASEINAALSGATTDLVLHSLRTSPALWIACVVGGVVLLVISPGLLLGKWLSSLRGSQAKRAIDVRKPLLARVSKVSQRFSDDDLDLKAA